MKKAVRADDVEALIREIQRYLVLLDALRESSRPRATRGWRKEHRTMRKMHRPPRRTCVAVLRCDGRSGGRGSLARALSADKAKEADNAKKLDGRRRSRSSRRPPRRRPAAARRPRAVAGGRSLAARAAASRRREARKRAPPAATPATATCQSDSRPSSDTAWGRYVVNVAMPTQARRCLRSASARAQGRRDSPWSRLTPPSGRRCRRSDPGRPAAPPRAPHGRSQGATTATAARDVHVTGSVHRPGRAATWAGLRGRAEGDRV